MFSFKSKILPYWRRIKGSLPNFSGRRTAKQAEMDRKLVYSLSPRKIPNSRQLRHLKKFLNPKELLAIKLALLVFLLSLGGLGFFFIKDKTINIAVKGGQYVEGAVGYPKGTNPIYSLGRDIDQDLSRLIYSSLFRYEKDGRLKNDLAESYEVSADGKEYKIKIKSGVKWHDGSDLSADDVIFTFNLIKDAEYRSPLKQSLSIAEVEKNDDYSVKFILSEPYAPFLELLSFGVLPKSLWESITPDSIILSELNLKPIGTGPFKFKSIKKNKSGEIKEYLLEANEDYYGKKPYLSNIKFIFFADKQEAIKALNDKQIMGISYIPFSSKKDLLAKNSLHINELVQPQTMSIFLNSSKDSALSDKETRIALTKAIDKNRIISDIFEGSYRAADGPYLEESPAYDKEMTKISYDSEAAAAVLKAKNLELALTVVDAANNVMVAEKIKEYWSAVGVKVDIKSVSSEQAANLIKNRDYEVLLYGQSVGGDPDIYAFWHSSQTSGSGLNLAGYNNPEVDKILLEARTIQDVEVRMSKYREVQKQLLSDAPAIFLYFPNYIYVQSRDLNGFSGTALVEPADRFSDVSDWYIKTKKRLSW